MRGVGFKDNRRVQPGSLAIVLQRLHHVFFNAQPPLIKLSEINLRRRISLIGGFFIPFGGANIVRRPAEPLFIDIADIRLRNHVTLICLFHPHLQGRFVVAPVISNVFAASEPAIERGSPDGTSGSKITHVPKFLELTGEETIYNKQVIRVYRSFAG